MWRGLMADTSGRSKDCSSRIRANRQWNGELRAFPSFKRPFKDSTKLKMQRIVPLVVPFEPTLIIQVLRRV